MKRSVVRFNQEGAAPYMELPVAEAGSAKQTLQMLVGGLVLAALLVLLGAVTQSALLAGLAFIPFIFGYIGGLYAMLQPRKKFRRTMRLYTDEVQVWKGDQLEKVFPWPEMKGIKRSMSMASGYQWVLEFEGGEKLAYIVPSTANADWTAAIRTLGGEAWPEKTSRRFFFPQTRKFLPALLLATVVGGVLGWIIPGFQAMLFAYLFEIGLLGSLIAIVSLLSERQETVEGHAISVLRAEDMIRIGPIMDAEERSYRYANPAKLVANARLLSRLTWASRGFGLMGVAALVSLNLLWSSGVPPIGRMIILITLGIFGAYAWLITEFVRTPALKVAQHPQIRLLLRNRKIYVQENGQEQEVTLAPMKGIRAWFDKLGSVAAVRRLVGSTKEYWVRTDLLIEEKILDTLPEEEVRELGGDSETLSGQ